MTCRRCDAAKQRVVVNRVVFDRDRVVTYMRLACGHAWHRTTPNVRGLLPASPRIATIAPCDCPAETD